MDTRFQQFLNANTQHNYSFGYEPGLPSKADHPAEHGIDFDVVMARLRCASIFALLRRDRGARRTRIHTEAVSRFSFRQALFSGFRQRAGKVAEPCTLAIIILQPWATGAVCIPIPGDGTGSH
jgi:hypothetical protein